MWRRGRRKKEAMKQTDGGQIKNNEETVAKRDSTERASTIGVRRLSSEEALSR